jgi:hypothetical protein
VAQQVLGVRQGLEKPAPRAQLGAMGLGPRDQPGKQDRPEIQAMQDSRDQLGQEGGVRILAQQVRQGMWDRQVPQDQPVRLQIREQLDQRVQWASRSRGQRVTQDRQDLLPP